jgi:hypothetical protein
MWGIDTPWFDVAIVMSIFAIGNILFGHFEEHKPKMLRLLKLALFTGVVTALSVVGLRWLAYSLLGVLGIVAVYVHGVWLPRHGINGLTGEPKEKYYELLRMRRKRGNA